MFDNIKINVYCFIFFICYYYIISFCHKYFPSLHHANRTWLYSEETCLMFDSLSLWPSLLRTKLHSIKIWFLMNLSANQNLFSLSTCINVLCYEYIFNNSIPAMLVHILTSGCNSNCITFFVFELNWLLVDQNHISISNSWMNKLRHDDQLILQFKKDSIFYSTFVLPYL